MLIWTEILPRKSWLTTSLGSCIQLWLAVFRHLSDYQFEYLSNLWNLQPILHWINVSGLLLRAGFRRFNYSIAIQFPISQECQWYTWLEMWERTDWRPASSPQVRQGGQSTHWHTERRTLGRSVNTQGTLGTPECSHQLDRWTLVDRQIQYPLVDRQLQYPSNIAPKYQIWDLQICANNV